MASFSVRHEPLSFAPLKIIDIRYTNEPIKSCSFWSYLQNDSYIAAAGWGQHQDLLQSNAHSGDCGISLYRI